LENKMKIWNWNDVVFPIIKIEPYEPFPKNVDDIRITSKFNTVYQMNTEIELNGKMLNSEAYEEK